MCRGTRGLSGLPCRDLAAGAWDGVAGEPGFQPSLPSQQSPSASLHSPQPISLPLGGPSLREAPLEGVKESGVWPHLYPGVGLVPYPPPPKTWSSEDVGYTGQTEQMDKLEKSRCEGFNLGSASKKSCPPCPALRGLSLNKLEVPHPACPFHPSRGAAKIVYLKKISKLFRHTKKECLAIQPNPSSQRWWPAL